MIHHGKTYYSVGVRLYKDGKRIDTATRRAAMERFGTRHRFATRAEGEAYRDSFPEDLRPLLEVNEAMDLGLF